MLLLLWFMTSMMYLSTCLLPYLITYLYTHLLFYLMIYLCTHLLLYHIIYLFTRLLLYLLRLIVYPYTLTASSFLDSVS
jgi:hypothetical protein